MFAVFFNENLIGTKTLRETEVADDMGETEPLNHTTPWEDP